MVAEPPVNGNDGETSIATAPFVVGIGASAGGLEALSQFLQRISLDSAAYLIVQHLAPTRQSMLVEILGRSTRLPVVTMVEGTAIESNVIYVAPPGADVTLVDGKLHLAVATGPNRPTLPVDILFRSLAVDCGPRAIGVVLSGTGSDGTLGMAAIKAAGGITFAQEPTTAKFDGMPRSALESGVADFRLSAEDIAVEIMHVSRHPYLRPRSNPLQLEEHLDKLSSLIRVSFGLDLDHYRPATIDRRLQRRMAVNRIERFEDYLRLCETDAKELAALHRDLLINVTSFFRDKETFELLRTKILPRILADREDGSDIRIWVAGCSSGEEAYSIAICLLEASEQADRNMKVQIFGTDLDADAIAQARRGVYPSNIAADVSAERLREFFVKTEDGQYQVSRRVRDTVVFSLQNLSRDAPFSRLDLVSCRNLLIYLQPGIQQKVLRILHYALKPGGTLLLGSSESIGESSDLFTLTDRKNKLYVSKAVALATAVLDLGVGLPTARGSAHDRLPRGTVRPMISIAHLADRKILEQYAPPGVVVNENLDILYFRGRTGAYLEQPTGVATHNILRLSRPELHGPLRQAIDEVLASGQPATAAAAIGDATGGFRPLTVIVQPLQEPETRARCLLILFKEPSSGPHGPAEPAVPGVPDEPHVKGQETNRARLLAQELSLTKDYLQTTIEDLARANEDLKASNEELQSSNEELQSTNEELETSKEELQSTNEELITLNEELQNRMRDLGTANDDLHNVLNDASQALIIVGRDRRIRRFTVAAEKLLDLLPSDVGRSVSRLQSFVGGLDVDELASDAIDELMAVERDVQGADQRWYRLRIVPYKTLDLHIRGAVLSLTDIDDAKRRHEATQALDEYASELLAAIPSSLLVVDADQRVTWVNDVFVRAFDLKRDELIGRRLSELDGSRWDSSELVARMDETLRSGASFRGLELSREFHGRGATALRVSGSRVRGLASNSHLVLLSVEEGRQ